ncbi:ABC-three component system middle component 6 [Ruegeria sp. EL01]|uniref:ABC-three component system middle component 6 n=1 Tax=Ruegeria sp. EL01 TaxID=2107578 RepID=UPI000EA8287F|nr:ABC-three component system middle component 6 [Ruegeria sp. EL01]
MILPTKHIRPERALLTVGADILACLKRPMTVSRVWDEVREQRGEAAGVAPINYDWFILALDLLFITKAVSFENGLLRKGAP